jgi:hypothetical protein
MQWWGIFDEYNVADLLYGMILDRDWSKVFQFHVVCVSKFHSL